MQLHRLLTHTHSVVAGNSHGVAVRQQRWLASHQHAAAPTADAHSVVTVISPACICTDCWCTHSVVTGNSHGVAVRQQRWLASHQHAAAPTADAHTVSSLATLTRSGAAAEMAGISPPCSCTDCWHTHSVVTGNSHGVAVRQLRTDRCQLPLFRHTGVADSRQWHLFETFQRRRYDVVKLLLFWYSN